MPLSPSEISRRLESLRFPPSPHQALPPRSYRSNIFFCGMRETSSILISSRALLALQKHISSLTGCCTTTRHTYPLLLFAARDASHEMISIVSFLCIGEQYCFVIRNLAMRCVKHTIHFPYIAATSREEFQADDSAVIVASSGLFASLKVRGFEIGTPFPSNFSSSLQIPSQEFNWLS